MLLRAHRLVALAGALGLALLVGRGWLIEGLVRFQAPHTARPSAARLDTHLSRAVEDEIEAANSRSVDAMVHLSLRITGAQLHFGLGHATSLEFRGEREGNCIEYAHLFASVFNRAADRKELAVRAYVVHSDARVLGRRVPGRGLDEHDWVMIVPAARGAPRLFVDPTLHDLGLPWDISRVVSGEVHAP